MPPVRPILDTFQRTPWIANEPVGEQSVRDLIPDQVQVAFTGTGPVESRSVVPLTPAAHSLLYGPNRDAARTFFRGVLGGIQGREGVSELRGMSLSTSPAAFATNMMMSNIEAGYFDDTISTGERTKFMGTFQHLAQVAPGIGAQNTGWMDLSPGASADALDVIEHGAAAGQKTIARLALKAVHETQHSITPHGPDMDPDLVWLEEGSAEALAWWPGEARDFAARIGTPLRDDPNPYTVTDDMLPGYDYRERRQSVNTLLGLAGVEQYHDDGTPDAAGRAAATQLLQGSSIEQVPRNLARAIARTQHLRAQDVEPLAVMIVSTDGKLAATNALADAIRGTRTLTN